MVRLPGSRSADVAKDLEIKNFRLHDLRHAVKTYMRSIGCLLTSPTGCKAKSADSSAASAGATIITNILMRRGGRSRFGSSS